MRKAVGKAKKCKGGEGHVRRQRNSSGVPLGWWGAVKWEWDCTKDHFEPFLISNDIGQTE